MKPITTIVLLLALAISGCCDQVHWPWCDSPSPAPDPTPVPPFGTVIKTFPAESNGPGSIDLDGVYFWEYCRGETVIQKRRRSDGEVVAGIGLDPRLTKLWGVAYDKFKDCFWCSNPECENIDYNIIQLSTDGKVIGGDKMMGGSSGNWIRHYDIDVNEHVSFTDPDGYVVKIGDLFTISTHFSLPKWEYDNVDNPTHYTEPYWFKSDIWPRAGTVTGNTYWHAEDTGTKIIEYYFSPRKSVAKRTGRIIDVGAVMSSLKWDGGRAMWGKGTAGGVTKIYLISLGGE